MQNKIVLDSCVFNKIFLEEDDKNQAIDLIKELTKQKYMVLAPKLFLYEVLTIASANNFPTKDIFELIIQYQKVNLELVDLDDMSVLKAIEICESGNKKSGFPSFYDSSYHALAITNNCILITSDKRHISKTHQFWNVILLKDWKSIFEST